MLKSMTLLINHIHHDSLNLSIINITPHKLIQLESASKSASLCPGIKVNKYPRIKLPSKQENIIIIEFFNVNHLILTLLS